MYSHSFLQQIANLDEDTIKRLRQSLELGRWPDNRALTAQQKETVLEAVLLWEKQTAAAERTGALQYKKGDAPDNSGAPENIKMIGPANKRPDR